MTSNGQDIVLGHRNILEENSKILGGGSSFSLLEKNPMEGQNSCNYQGRKLDQLWFDI